MSIGGCDNHVISISLGFALSRHWASSQLMRMLPSALLKQDTNSPSYNLTRFRYVLVRRGEWFKGIGDLSTSAFSVAANLDEMQDIPGDDEGDLCA